MAKDVVVVVQRDSLPSEKESLDLLLISTAGAYPVGLYRDVDSVEKIYGAYGVCPNAKIVRKAKTLFNQGKTTLAEALVDKVKIVGLEPPEATPAAAAIFKISFAEVALTENINAGESIWVKIGDDKAVVKATAASEITNGMELAAMFDGTSFTKGGKTYSAAVDGTEAVYTASEAGEADSIPEKVSFYTDELMTNEITLSKVTVDFVNGVDAVSAADKLIEDIKKFQKDVDDDWYYFMTDKDEDEYVKALAKFAEASEPTEAELDTGVEDHRKFYMGQTSNKNFVCEASRAAVIYTAEEYLNEEPDASYTGNVAPFYPNSVTWKFKRPQDGNASASEGTKLISLPQLTEGERSQLLEHHVNFLTEEYKRQYVKDGTCLDGEFIDVVLGGDWIAKRMRDLLYDILLSNANIDYNDAGFGLVSTAVLQALTEAADYKIVARDLESRAGIFTVNVPKYEESTEEQRRNRVMPDITWEAQLSGAIHQVKAKGVLRASL